MISVSESLCNGKVLKIEKVKFIISKIVKPFQQICDSLKKQFSSKILLFELLQNCFPHFFDLLISYTPMNFKTFHLLQLINVAS